jgi:hypothetical protein
LIARSRTVLSVAGGTAAVSGGFELRVCCVGMTDLSSWPSEAVGVAAARLRGAHPISLPDAYCLATARTTDAHIASFDENVLRAADHEGIPTTTRTAARRPPQR